MTEDLPTATPTAWAMENDTASHAELICLRARACNAECTAKTPRLGVAETGAFASANMATAITAPAAAGQPTSTSGTSLMPPRPTRQVGGALPAATKVSADLTSHFIDMTAAPLKPAALSPAALATSTTSSTEVNCNWSSWDERFSANTGDAQLRCSEPFPQLARGGLAHGSATSVLAQFAAAIDTDVPGYKPSLIFATYGR